MNEHCFDVSMALENIGPHSDEAKLEFNEQMTEHRLAVYAPNGAGKTFISRMFRAAMLPAEKSNPYLTKGKSAGKFSFGIKRLENSAVTNSGSLEISLKKDKKYTVSNNLGMLFHVFNSDFVEENVRPNNYNPQKNITGYIIGRTQIELSDEKAQEEELKTEFASVKDRINMQIASALAELKHYKVNSATTEFKRINENYLRGLGENYLDCSFEEISTKLEMLMKIPEDLAAVSSPKLSVSDDILFTAKGMLLQEYPKAEWDDAFIQNSRFIENGISIMGESECCPFCKQSLSVDAKHLIGEYKRFLEEKKISVHRELDDIKESLSEIIYEIENFIKSTDAIARETNFTASLFPSLEDITITVPDKTIPDCFEKLIALVEEKKQNVEKNILCSDIVEQCIDYLTYLRTFEQENCELINNFNKAKYNLNNERLNLKKMLCNAQAARYSAILADDFSKLSYIEKRLEELHSLIRSKENESKFYRKDCFFNTLEYFLNAYFNGKYIIDRDTFEVKFRDENIGTSAQKVFSEGERSIVAFCYYLASVHLIVERSSDYNRLFFVIDDPTVGMDSHYINRTAQLLNELRSHFEMTGAARVWVFTHSTDFIRCLTSENVVSNVYTLSDGKFILRDNL